MAVPTCGAILVCVAAECGLTNITCAQTCADGASAAVVDQALAVALCGAQHCVADGGTPMLGPPLFLCLASNCAPELAACGGVPAA
jgi:hypothetical protein